MGGMRHHVLCSQWKRPLSCLSKSQSLRWQTQKLISCSPCGRSKKLHADLHLSTQSGHLEITCHWIVRATALLWRFSSRCPPFSQSHTQLCLTPRSSCYHPWQPSTFSNFPSRLFSSISMIPYPTSWNHPSDLLQGYWMVMTMPPLFRHRPFLPPSRQCESGKGNECPSVSRVGKKELGRGRGADRRAEHVDVGRPSVTFRENICSF